MNTFIQRYSLLIFFILLLLTHLLASLSIFPLMERQWIWIGGTLASFVWVKRQGKESQLPSQPDKDIYSPWTWVFLIAAGIFLRSLRFWAFPQWPLLDEFCTFQSGLELNQHWDWRFFRSDGQTAPLLDWATGILFKVADPTFLALLLPPFLVSCLTLLAGFWFAKRFLPENLAFISTAFLALAYWPIYLQGFALQAACLPFWEMGVFFLLAETIKKGWSNSSSLWIFGLGVWFGLGYWAYTSWPVVTLAALAIVWFSAKQSRWNYRVPLFLGAGLFTSGLFFVIAAIQVGGYGTHLAGYSAFHGWMSEKQVLISALDYINSLFWGFWSLGAYGPTQGGFLNPLMAALLWVGLWDIFTNRTLPRFSRWVISILLFFLLPGLFSQNYQGLRIIQAMPLLLVLSAWGAYRLIASFPTQGRSILLSLILIGSLAWDSARLTINFTTLTNQTTEIRLLYEALKKLATNQGPILCFTQFKIQNHNEENLEAMVYPFNALENPRFDIHNTHWASIILTPDEVPFLQMDFPKTQWITVPMQTDGGYQLSIGLIPINPKETMRLEKWARANQWFEKANWKFLNISNPSSYQEALQYWLAPPAFLKEDKFLQTCYWEKLSDFYYSRGYETHYNVQLGALKHAVTEGYPAPHLYYDLGCLLLRGGNYPEARIALETGLRGDPNNPSIKNALGILEEMEKRKPIHS